MYTYLSLIVLAFLVTGCTLFSSPAQEAEPFVCSCRTYVAPSEKPAWVGEERFEKGVYYSYGLSQCTGIKSVDVNTAGVHARQQLVMMLRSDVQSEVVLERSSDSALNQGQERGTMSVRVGADKVLRNSQLYDTWVDPVNCVIYQAVRISQQSIDDSIQKEREKMRYQSFFVEVKDPSLAYMKQQIAVTLSSLGVQKIVEKEGLRRADNVYTLVASLSSIQRSPEKKMIRIHMLLRLYDADKTLLWSSQFPGKALSYSAYKENVLLEKAMRNALQGAKKRLLEMLHTHKNNF